MGLFERKRHRREDMAMVRRVVDGSADQPWYRLPNWFWELAVLIGLAVVLVMICFWGRPPHLPVLLIGTESRVRHEAPFDFQYTSKYQKELRLEQTQRRTPPVYRVATELSDVQLQRYRQLLDTATGHFAELKNLPQAERDRACLKLIVDSGVPGLPERMNDDLARIVELKHSKEEFRQLLQESLSILETLLQNGIYEVTGGARIHALRSADGQTASRNLHDNLESIASRETTAYHEQTELTAALFDLFKPGLIPNLQVNEDATRLRQEEAMREIGDVVVEVHTGDLLLEPGMRITEVTLERWNAYKREMATRSRADYGLTQALLENILIAVSVIVLIGLYSRIVPPSTPRKRRDVSLTALLVLVNLLMIRFVLDWGESPALLHFLGGKELFFWLAPPAFAAIMVTMLVGPYMAVLATLLVCSFSAMMLGRSVDVLSISILSCLIGIYFSRGARNRNTVVKAGFLSGLAVAIPVFFICLSAKMPWPDVLLQTLVCLLSGLGTGIIAVGLIPMLENLFKITTDITLLELTDYNHPLLSKLQFIAPGTFHHSVMVANLAERAAAQIGANALLCRCAALFHDVGKMVKPEYFVENQITGINPHSTISPSMSALVIKSHVREGVEIAKEYKLPRVIIDIIEQHHGTGLIQFFYHKARQQLAENGAAKPNEESASDDTRALDEKIFRYDGPRPRSKEAAIVLFADSVEAASRALKKVTPQAIEEMVDRLVSDRLADGQLDLSPLTFREVQRVRATLKFYLVNMLHHRVEYPEATPAPEKNRIGSVTHHALGSGQ